MKSFLSYIKQISAMALLFLFIALFVRFLDRQGFRDILTTWIAAQERRAFVLFILSAAVLYSVALPGNMLGAIAFILFGFRDGVLSMCAAGILSSFMIFFLVRLAFFSIFQKWLRRQPGLLPLANTLQNRSAAFYCLVRISPFHATFVTILYALTTIDIRKFAISLCAMLPQWLLYVYFGYAAAEAATSSAGMLSAPNILRFASIAVFIVVIVYVSRVVEQELTAKPTRPESQS